MAVLEFILIVLLQFEGISAGFISPYHRVGDVVIFHCYSKIYSEPCSTINWLYDQHLTVGGQTVVQDGKVDQSSPRAARLSLDSFCSLTINNITAEDAGRYICQFRDKYSTDGLLNVLSISPSDVGPTEDGDVTLHCSLRRYDSYCPENSLLWVDETGTQLKGEGVRSRLGSQTNCVSSLTVKHQNGRNRRFSCQIFEENEVKIEAHYTSVSAGPNGGHVHHRAGDDVVLSCSSPSSEPCSSVSWLYNRHGNMKTQTEVQDGKVLPSSPRAARLSVNSFCSLIINNITAEDAGRYTCRLWDRDIVDSFVSLNILSLSPSDVGPTEDGDVTLHCSLRRYESSCPENSLLWVDETGTQLTAEGDGYKVRGQTNCVSSLTVKHQNGRNRRFSCQFVEENEVKIEAHYPPVSADIKLGKWEMESKGKGSPLKSIMWTLRVSGLILMMGITVGLIRTRGCKKPLKDTDVHYVAADDTAESENVGERPAAPTLT